MNHKQDGIGSSKTSYDLQIYIFTFFVCFAVLGVLMGHSL